MSYGVNLSYGARYLLDRRMDFTRAAHQTYLRLRNFGDIQNQLWSQLGFSIAPTGSGATPGTTDVAIRPSPAVNMVSMTSIGMSGGKLRIGARTFLISDTFVDAQMRARNIDTPDNVFRNHDVVGLVIDKQLFDIVTILHEEVAGSTVSWLLTCNAVDSSVNG